MSKYPTNIDTNSELPPIVDGVSETGGVTINALIEAVFAIETALGTDPQGIATDVATRLAAVLNPDGTLKSTALPSTLIDLPLGNSEIASGAAIAETKLDLDVGTQALQDLISSNDLDIANLQESFTLLINRYGKHIIGTGERHTAAQIDHVLADGYGAGIGTTVATALDYLSGLLDAHRVATAGREHWAGAIGYVPPSVVPGIPSVITGTNVQDALDQVDGDIRTQFAVHSDEAHSDGISNDGYIALGGQAVVNDASLHLTRFKPNSGDQLIKIGLANSAVVKTKGFRPGDIDTGANAVDIQVSIGTSTRTLSITTLENSAYPSGTGRVTLAGVVDLLNGLFANAGSANHFPVTAFASDDGELVLQHNIARDDCTITIVAPGANSAIAALGFTDIVGQEVGRLENYAYRINGARFTELKTVLSDSRTQASTSAVVDLGTDIGAAGIRINHLFHVFSHATAAAAGTYRIDGYAGNTITINENLTSGAYSYIIYEDTMDNNALVSNRHVLDYYLDENRLPVTSDRAVIVFGGLEGVKPVEISPNFSALTGSYTLATSGTQRALSITDGDGYVGISTLFDPGFIGYLKVWAPDNAAYMTVLVDDITPTNGTNTITVIDSEFQDDRLLLGTSHHNGLTTVQLPLNRINVGMVGNNAIGSEFKRDFLETDVNAFHLSGVIRGFDIILNTSSLIRVRGGVAYIGGKKIEKTSQNLEVLNFALADGTWNVVLTREANLEIYEESTGLARSYPVADILLSEDLILLAQVTIASSVITDTLDARFMVNDIESRLQLTVDDRDLGAGSFRTLEAAVLYSKEAPNDTKPEITILSDLTFTDALVIDSGSRIVSFGDLTFNGDLTLSTNSTLKSWGTLDVTGVTTLNSGATLESLGGGTHTGALVMNDDSEFDLDGYVTMSAITVSGNRATILGKDAADRPDIHFTGTGIALGGISNFLMKDIDLINTGLNAMVTTSSTTNYSIENCTFAQEATPTVGQITQSARAGIVISGTDNAVDIIGCTFTGLSRAIDVTTCTTLKVSNCLFDTVDHGIYVVTANSVTDFSLTESTFLNLHTSGITLSKESERVLISNCTFKDNFDVTSNPTAISSDAGHAIISNNQFDNFDSFRIISIVDATPGEGWSLTNNLIEGCTTSIYAIDVGSSGDYSYNVTGNIVRNNTGQVFQGRDGGSITGNYFESLGLSGTTPICFFENCIITGNSIVAATGDGEVQFQGRCQFNGNYVSVGRMDVNNNIEICSNEILLNDTTAATSMDLNAGSAGAIIVSDNKIGIGATAVGIQISSGSTVVTGNVIKDLGGSHTRTIDIDALGATEFAIVSNNVIENGATYGIEIDSDNVVAEGNIMHGALTNGDIVVATGHTNILITGNLAQSTGGDPRRIYHVDAGGGTPPTGVFISRNKGATEKRVTSPYTSTALDEWTYTLNGVDNEVQVSAPQQLLIPLNNLPEGSVLDSVVLHVSNSGGTGAATAEIYRRPTTGVAVSISATTNVPAGAFSTLSISPTSTENIQASLEYFLVVDIPSSLASGVITVGQVVANVII